MTTKILGIKGNFKTFNAANNWLQQVSSKISTNSATNSSTGFSVEVRGVNEVENGTNISYNNFVSYEGNGGTLNFSGTATLKKVKFYDLTIALNNTITITSDVEFYNCDITVNTGTGFIIGDNTIFINCNFRYVCDTSLEVDYDTDNLSNHTQGVIFCESSSQKNHIKNIKISDCKFTTSDTNHFSFISLLLTEETHSYEDILINNNNFYNTSGSEDRRSVISIISTIITNPSQNYGPRLINCSVSNNKCEQNQLLLITGKLNGSDRLVNLPTTINVSVNNNVCGAICYLNRQDTPLSTVNSTAIYDKLNSFNISNNNCQFIFNGVSTGFIDATDGYFGVDLINDTQIFSGSAQLINNTCSFIHVGILDDSSNPTENQKLLIENNRIIANNNNILSNYYSTATPENIGLIVDGVSSDSNNIFIKDNIISSGKFGSTQYTFDNILSLNASSLVSGNTFSGATTNENMVEINDCACTLINNKFVRGSTEISAYINASGTKDQNIYNNSFDQYYITSDPLDDILVTGLTKNSIYKENRNQTTYITVPLTLSAYKINGTNNGQTIISSETNYKTFIRNSIYLELQTSSTSQIQFQIDTDLSLSLPKDIRLVQVKMGIVRSVAGSPVIDTGGVNEFQGTVIAYDSAYGGQGAASFSVGTDSILDAKNNNDANFQKSANTFAFLDLNSGTNFTDISDTMFFDSDDLTDLNIDASYAYFTTNNNYTITSTFYYYAKMTSGTLNIVFSPIIAKCRW